MSYDLVFARPRVALDKQHMADAFDALRRGQPGDAFEELPTTLILDGLVEQFENFEPAAQFPTISAANGSAEVFWQSHRFAFSFRGDTGEMQDQIIELMRKFSCPVYDPQGSSLYPLDNPPQFGGSATANEEAMFKSMVDSNPAFQQLLARVAEMRRKREQEHRDENAEFYDAVDRLEAQIDRQCAAGRWGRLGLTANFCAAVLHNMQLAWGYVHRQYDPRLAQPGQPTGVADINWEATLSDNVDQALNIVVLAFLEAIPPDHQFRDPFAVAQDAAAKAVEFFHGDWRNGHREFYYSEPMTPADSRSQMNWIDAYRAGFLLALYADDESAIRRIIDWPDTDLRVDDGTLDLTAADNKLQIALAMALRGEPAHKVDAVAEEIRRSKRKRAIVAWTAVEAIMKGDASGFSTQFKALVQLYRKSGFRTNRLDTVIHIDGSILWHVARRRKIALPELPQGSLDTILRIF